MKVIRSYTFCATLPWIMKIAIRFYTFCAMLPWTRAVFEGSVAWSLGTPTLLRSYAFLIRSHAIWGTPLDAKFIFVGNVM